MEIKTLSNPPIIEALLEIRFNPNKNVTIGKIEKFVDAISRKFPKKEPLADQTIKFVFSEKEAPQHDLQVQPSGFKVVNTQGNRVVIGALDKFVVSFLVPYTPWPDLKDTAKQLYEQYLEYVPQTEIARLGARYINKVQFPLNDAFEFEKYMNTFPTLPEHSELEKSVSGFETVVVIPHSDIGCASTIRQVLLKREGSIEAKTAHLPFVLDIDVHQSKTYEDVKDAEVWNMFDKMRTKKNAIFFSSLTDLALQPYE